jgi:hypothetical protein
MENVANVVNPKNGKTIREENMEKTWRIPIGALVEISTDNPDDNGLCLFVYGYNRDCDGTPLYALSVLIPEEHSKWEHKMENLETENQKVFFQGFLSGSTKCGYSEESLIPKPFIFMLIDDPIGNAYNTRVVRNGDIWIPNNSNSYLRVEDDWEVLDKNSRNMRYAHFIPNSPLRDGEILISQKT